MTNVKAFTHSIMGWQGQSLNSSMWMTLEINVIGSEDATGVSLKRQDFVRISTFSYKPRVKSSWWICSNSSLIIFRIDGDRSVAIRSMFSPSVYRSWFRPLLKPSDSMATELLASVTCTVTGETQMNKLMSHNYIYATFVYVTMLCQFPLGKICVWQSFSLLSLWSDC